MKTQVVIDPEILEPELIIKTNAITPDIENLLALANRTLLLPAKNTKGEWVLVDPKDIVRIWSEDKRVLAKTLSETLYLQEPLAKMEPQLKPHRFVRISSSELVNIRFAKSFDLSMTGTIVVLLKNGEKSYVSRRKVHEIKELLKGGRL